MHVDGSLLVAPGSAREDNPSPVTLIPYIATSFSVPFEVYLTLYPATVLTIFSNPIPKYIPKARRLSVKVTIQQKSFRRH